MKPESTPDQATASPKRRALVVGLGIGGCAAVAGLLRWPSGNSSTATISQAAPSNTRVIATAAAPAETGLEEIAKTAGNADKLTREWFAPHLNSRFEISSQSGYSSLKLVEITPGSTLKNGSTSYTGFALEFDGPPEPTPEAKIYTVKHDVLGEMELFLSPVGRYPDRTRYEAVFTQKA